MNLNEKVAALRPGKTFFYQEETLESIQFLDDDVEPVTQEEIDKESPRLEYEYESAKVEQRRRASYQTESDPLFFGWQRGDNTEQEWLDAVQAVKDAYPYPEVTK
jgi:hypothetical protein